MNEYLGRAILIHGNDAGQILKTVSSISSKVADADIIRYYEYDPEKIENTIYHHDLLCRHKVVQIYNTECMSYEKIPNNVLVLLILYKLLPAKTVKNLDSIVCYKKQRYQIKQMILDTLKGYTISNDALELLIKNIGYDTTFAEYELQKIRLLKYNEKTIEYNDVLDISVNLETKYIYDLCSVAIKKDIKSFIDIAHKLHSMRTNVIIITIALRESFAQLLDKNHTYQSYCNLYYIIGKFIDLEQELKNYRHSFDDFLHSAILIINCTRK